jgi:integrase
MVRAEYQACLISAVSTRLGHKNEVTTLTMYAEALPRYDGEAAAAFAALFFPQGF